MQDEIAGLIAQNLQLKLGTSQRAAKEVNPEAHRLVLEGQHFLNMRTLDGFTKAEGAFIKARVLDAEFAPAHAGLADTLQVRVTQLLREGASMREVGEDWRRALTMAQRAKELDPTLPEPYATLGYALMIERQFPEADEQFRRAVELNPNYARAYSYRSAIWLAKGRLDECIRQNEKSGEVDPLWMPFLGAQGDYLFYAQRLAEALKITDRAMMLQPTGVTALGARARVQLALGLKAEAIATARFIRSHPESGIRRDADISAIYVLRQAGLSQEAEAYADERFKALSQTSFQRGGVLGALGRFDEALPFLERTPTVSLPALVWDPMWDPWRSDPRFEKLFEKLNFTEPYKVGRATLARMLAEQAAKK